jgi:hypothetical protein
MKPGLWLVGLIPSTVHITFVNSMLRLSLEWHSDINHVQIREVQDIHVIFAAEDDLQVTFSKYFIILLNMFSV